MNLVVSNESLRATKYCPQAFSCLKGKPADFCRVEYCVEGEIHFLRRKSDRDCYYLLSFEKSYFCSCPTRKEIFNKYNI